MKYIKSINEFFGFFKDDEEDKIALQFIERLEKVKGDSPYEIKYIIVDEYNYQYEVSFDDVILIASRQIYNQVSMNSIYRLVIDDEKINCKGKYAKKIFNLINTIYQSDIKRKKLNKLKQNINPAADLLESRSVDRMDRIDLLRDLSVDLTDEGLYVEITTKDWRFENNPGENIFMLILDRDQVFCKRWPDDDMDWLNDKPIIKEFIKRLDDFGMKYDVDYEVYAGGLSITLWFSGKKGIDSIKL